MSLGLSLIRNMSFLLAGRNFRVIIPGANTLFAVLVCGEIVWSTPACRGGLFVPAGKPGRHFFNNCRT